MLHLVMQIHRSITEILELCFSFSELIQGLNSKEFTISPVDSDLLERLATVSVSLGRCVVNLNHGFAQL